MNNTLQKYIPAEDEMISSGLGLIAAAKLKGAIPFREFKTTFSATSFLRGYYNYNEGDIYQFSIFTVRGEHSRVAARLTNYNHRCENIAFGKRKSTSPEDLAYLEFPNSHSAIFDHDYLFPSPLSDREVINNIVWKRMSEKSVVMVYYPVNTHPKVEIKPRTDIRATQHAIFHVTQLDNGSTELQFCFHFNFGGHLPKAIVNSFIMPTYDRVLSHYQAYFAYSISSKKLTKTDGKLLGEVFVNQIKKAREKGGWKKRGELGKVGVDQFLYISAAMMELLPRYPWLRALLHTISVNQVKVAPTVTITLSDIKDGDAINLGKGLCTTILTNTEASAAVDH